jgi:uncharacterized repeat protein (TIGR01451 family)
MFVRLVQRRLRVALAFLLLSAAPVLAGPKDVQVSLTAHRVAADANGQTTLEPGDQARPGDVIEYRVRYSNQAPTGVRRLVATLPIPKGMEYLPRTAHPARVEASLDGRSFAPVPLTRKVRLANGREVVREVPPSEYRQLRWTLGDLAAHGSETVTARVRVSPAGPVTAAVAR